MTGPDRSDDIWSRAEIESPCVKICILHPDTGTCLGCHRTRDEIARWSAMAPGERRAIMADLPARGAAPRHRRGGRAGRIARAADRA